MIFISLSGCTLTSPDPEPPSPTPIPEETIQAEITPVPASADWVDMAGSVNGICFEAAFDARNRVFVLRDAQEHIRFYDSADNSQLCSRKVGRVPVNFDGGFVLAGLWSYDTGCTAHHDVLEFTRDDAAKTITFRLHFITEGDCPYELLRPFWVGIPAAADYQITLTVE